MLQRLVNSIAHDDPTGRRSHVVAKESLPGSFRNAAASREMLDASDFAILVDQVHQAADRANVQFLWRQVGGEEPRRHLDHVCFGHAIQDLLLDLRRSTEELSRGNDVFVIEHAGVGG